MKLRRTIALSILSIALTGTLVAVAPIFVEHQAFAYSGKGSGEYTTLTKLRSPNNLAGVGYGPCLGKGNFEYSWCVKVF
jgi:hypothetical protein